MASGVAAAQTCISTYQDLKLRHKHKYIIYNLNDKNTEIIVEESGNGDYNTFLSHLPKDQCRWAIYDFDYEHEGGRRNKITFYAWSPDTAKIKNKMLFASSKEALRTALVGIATEIQATDYDEVAYERVLEKVSRKL